MTRREDSDRIGSVLFSTVDPTPRVLDGKPALLPALTTMLYRVCDNDPARFEEAVRLVELFIAKALEVDE